MIGLLIAAAVILFAWLVATGVVWGQGFVPPPREEKPAVVVSGEYSNATGGGIPRFLLIRARNESGATIKAVRNFPQGQTIEQYRFVIRQADGKEIRQKRPFIGTPPHAPTDKDYVVLKPGESGALEVELNKLQNAFDLQPGRLYFIEVRVRFDGLPEPVLLVTAFGYTEARKD